MKILIFTTDVIPLPGLPTTGTSLRTYGIGEGLRAHGHEIIYSVPKQAIAGLEKNSGEEEREHSKEQLAQLKANSFDYFNQAKVLASHNPDIVICGHWPAMGLSVKPSQTLVVDLAGPHLLERHYQKSPGQPEAILGKLGVLASADYYIVSGPSQRLYFLSFLLRAGVENPERKIATLTMPLPPELPEFQESRFAKTENFPEFIFGGIFLPWQNPSWSLSEIANVIQEQKTGHLTLVGGKHPSHPIEVGDYGKLFDRLSQQDSVTTFPMLPYHEFIEKIRSSHVAVDAMKWNLERQLAVNIRTTTYLWAGTPVLYNDFADLASPIRDYNAGWTVPHGDSKALRSVLDEIIHEPSIVREKAINAQRLAKELFSWDTAVESLLKLVGSSKSKRLREIDIVVDRSENADFRLGKDKQIQQFFLCRVNGLSRVECRIATHDQEENPPLTMKLYSIENKKGHKALVQAEKTLVAECTSPGKELRNNEWIGIDITPSISSSAGQTFMLELEANGAQKGVSPWAAKGSPYPLLGLGYQTKLMKDACLCLRTTCSGQPSKAH